MTAILNSGLSLRLLLLNLLDASRVAGLGGGRVLADNLLLLVLPELLVALPEALNPRWEEATLELVGPGVLDVLVGRHNPATGSLLDYPDNGVDEDVGADTADQAVGNRVGEGHQGDGNKGGDGIANIVPVDVASFLSHLGADDDERAASCPWWNRSKDRGEENSDEKAEAGHHGSDTSAATFRDTSTRFDVGSDWGSTEEGTNGDTHGIDAVGDGAVLEILSALIKEATEAGHRVQSTSGIQNINVKEGDESQTELASISGDVKIKNSEGVLDRAECDDLLEKVESIVAQRCVWEVGDSSAAWPGDDADKQDTSNNGTLDTVEHKQDSEETAAEDANPLCSC